MKKLDFGEGFEWTGINYLAKSREGAEEVVVGYEEVVVGYEEDIMVLFVHATLGGEYYELYEKQINTRADAEDFLTHLTKESVNRWREREDRYRQRIS